MRWRCEFHCAYSLCERCYTEYWTRLSCAVLKQSDPKKRLEQLKLVPTALRGPPELETPQSCSSRGEDALPQAPGAPPTVEWSVHGRCQPPFDDAEGHGQQQAQGLAWTTLQVEGLWEVAGWIVVRAMAVWLVGAGTESLLGGDKPTFPYPWLIVAFSSTVAYVMCRLTNAWLGPVFGNEGEVHWKASGLIGGLQGLDVGLRSSNRHSSAAAVRTGMHMILPVFMVLAGMVAGIERSKNRAHQLVVAVGLATVGGLSMTLGSAGNVELGSAPWPLIATAILALRWTFTQMIIVNVNPSPLVLATRLLPPTALLCLEVAFWCELWVGGFTAVLRMTASQVALLLAAGVAFAVVLVAEVRLVQLTSATFLGFLSPICMAGTTFCQALLPGGRTPPFTSWVGISLCVAASWVYWRAGAAEHEERGSEPVDTGHYERLDAARASLGTSSFY